jgi:hypothetical protein
MLPVTKTVQALVLIAVPQGGQQVSRRNAWGCMSANSAWARTRREAIALMQRPRDLAATGR